MNQRFAGCSPPHTWYRRGIERVVNCRGCRCFSPSGKLSLLEFGNKAMEIAFSGEIIGSLNKVTLSANLMARHIFSSRASHYAGQCHT